jgi:hypothetical protein
MEPKKQYNNITYTYTVNPNMDTSSFVYLNPISLAALYKTPSEETTTHIWAADLIEKYLDKGDFTEANELLKKFVLQK